jgi:hypothetical protein
VFPTRWVSSAALPIEGVRHVAISSSGSFLIYLTSEAIGFATRDARHRQWEFSRQVPLRDGFSIDQGELIVSHTPVIGERLAVSDRGTFWLALSGYGMWLGHLRDLTLARTLDENDELARMPGFRPVFLGEDGATVSFLRSRFEVEHETQEASHLCAVDIADEKARWSGETSRVLAMHPPRFKSLSQAWSPDRRWCASVDAEGTCVVIERARSTSRVSSTAATISSENAASDEKLLAYQAAHEVVVCALDDDLMPREVATLGVPEGFRIRRVLTSQRFVVVSSEAADGRVSRQAWSLDGDYAARAVLADITPRTFERRPRSEEVRLSMSGGEILCSWQHDERWLRIVGLTTADDTAVEVADGTRDLVWEFSSDGRKLATYGGYEHPVRIVDTASRRELAAFYGTGAGIGRGWGGSPGDVAFVNDDTVAVVKRAGTCATWDLKSRSPVGRPVLTAEDASLHRIFLLRPEEGEHRLLVDAYGDCAWLITRSAQRRTRVTRVVGVSVVLGRWSEDMFVTATRTGELALLDLSHEARVQHLRSMGERSTGA